MNRAPALETRASAVSPELPPEFLERIAHVVDSEGSPEEKQRALLGLGGHEQVRAGLERVCGQILFEQLSAGTSGKDRPDDERQAHNSRATSAYQLLDAYLSAEHSDQTPAERAMRALGRVADAAVDCAPEEVKAGKFKSLMQRFGRWAQGPKEPEDDSEMGIRHYAHAALAKTVRGAGKFFVGIGKGLAWLADPTQHESRTGRYAHAITLTAAAAAGLIMAPLAAGAAAGISYAVQRMAARAQVRGAGKAVEAQALTQGELTGRFVETIRKIIPEESYDSDKNPLWERLGALGRSVKSDITEARMQAEAQVQERMSTPKERAKRIGRVLLSMAIAGGFGVLRGMPTAADLADAARASLTPDMTGAMRAPVEQAGDAITGGGPGGRFLMSRPSLRNLNLIPDVGDGTTPTPDNVLLPPDSGATAFAAQAADTIRTDVLAQIEYAFENPSQSGPVNPQGILNSVIESYMTDNQDALAALSESERANAFRALRITLEKSFEGSEWLGDTTPPDLEQMWQGIQAENAADATTAGEPSAGPTVEGTPAEPADEGQIGEPATSDPAKTPATKPQPTEPSATEPGPATGEVMNANQTAAEEIRQAVAEKFGKDPAVIDIDGPMADGGVSLWDMASERGLDMGAFKGTLQDAVNEGRIQLEIWGDANNWGINGEATVQHDFEIKFSIVDDQGQTIEKTYTYTEGQVLRKSDMVALAEALQSEGAQVIQPDLSSGPAVVDPGTGEIPGQPGSFDPAEATQLADRVQETIDKATKLDPDLTPQAALEAELERYMTLNAEALANEEYRKAAFAALDTALDETFSGDQWYDQDASYVEKAWEAVNLSETNGTGTDTGHGPQALAGDRSEVARLRAIPDDGTGGSGNTSGAPDTAAVPAEVRDAFKEIARNVAEEVRGELRYESSLTEEQYKAILKHEIAAYMADPQNAQTAQLLASLEPSELSALDIELDKQLGSREWYRDINTNADFYNGIFQEAQVETPSQPDPTSGGGTVGAPSQAAAAEFTSNAANDVRQAVATQLGIDPSTVDLAIEGEGGVPLETIAKAAGVDPSTLRSTLESSDILKGVVHDDGNIWYPDLSKVNVSEYPNGFYVVSTNPETGLQQTLFYPADHAWTKTDIAVMAKALQGEGVQILQPDPSGGLPAPDPAAPAPTPAVDPQAGPIQDILKNGGDLPVKVDGLDAGFNPAEAKAAGMSELERKILEANPDLGGDPASIESKVLLSEAAQDAGLNADVKPALNQLEAAGMTIEWGGDWQNGGVGTSGWVKNITIDSTKYPNGAYLVVTGEDGAIRHLIPYPETGTYINKVQQLLAIQAVQQEGTTGVFLVGPEEAANMIAERIDNGVTVPTDPTTNTPSPDPTAGQGGGTAGSVAITPEEATLLTGKVQAAVGQIPPYYNSQQAQLAFNGILLDLMADPDVASILAGESGTPNFEELDKLLDQALSDRSWYDPKTTTTPESLEAVWEEAHRNAAGDSGGGPGRGGGRGPLPLVSRLTEGMSDQLRAAAEGFSGWNDTAAAAQLKQNLVDYLNSPASQQWRIDLLAHWGDPGGPIQDALVERFGPAAAFQMFDAIQEWMDQQLLAAGREALLSRG